MKDRPSDAEVGSTLSPDGAAPATAPSPGEPAGRLADGQVLGEGRYRIVRFLAAGAMGEVYEAEDRVLSGHVALKRISPEIASRPLAAQRFKREIQLARRVTHRNVCRIFDLGGPGPVMFYTMELLGGETLAARLAARGRLSVAEARPIALQILAGLAEAHGAGVLHRDLKPHNVILDGDRAVITDFGLARLDEPASDERLTDAGAVLGTPAYMAPEQIEGREPTPATDVYAFGALLFETVTGTLPFKGPTPLASATRRLSEGPPRPRALVADLDPRWDAAILRCLMREPGRRYASAAAVAEALRAPPGRVRRWALLAVPIAALAAAAVVVLRAPPRPAAAPSMPTAGHRRTVATLGFRNLTGSPSTAWLATAISEMLRAELSASGLRSLAGEDVARAKVELGLADADGYGRETLARIHANLGADLVVAGAYTAVGGRLRLDVRVEDTATGEIVVETSESGAEGELLDIVARAGTRLRAALRAGAATANALASLPAKPEAARAYAEGLATLRALDPLAAIPLLERAAALEPDFPLTHAALAAAFKDLDRDREASAAAQRAFELSKGLPEEERLLVEGRYREATGDWSRAIAVYRSLHDLHPDDLEYGVLLAWAQTLSGGRRDEATATLASLRALPGAGDDPRLDLLEADPEENYDRAVGLNLAAARKAERRGARFLQVAALTSAAWSLVFLGEVDKARAVLDEARAIAQALGSRTAEVTVLNALGPVHALLGDATGAVTVFDEAVHLARSLGSQTLGAAALGNAAFARLDSGDLEAVPPLLAELRALAEQLGAPDRIVFALRLEAWLARERDDLATARSRLDEADRLESARADPSPAFREVQRGTLDLRAGDARAALERMERVEAAELLRNNQVYLAEERTLRIQALLQLGRPADALRIVGEATPFADKVPGYTARIAGLRARALLALGRRDEARAAIAAAAARADLGPLEHRVIYALAALAVEPGDAATRRRVEAILAEAEKKGVRHLAREARAQLAAPALR